MCKELNFVYMIDRMKYQYFDFFHLKQKGRISFITNCGKIRREEKFCGWKIQQPRPLSTFHKFSIGISSYSTAPAV